MKTIIIRVARIIVLLIIGYILISAVGVMVEERFSRFADEQELGYEQAELEGMVNLRPSSGD